MTQCTNKLFPPVLSIAGSDPSGGAGIQADLKTMSSLLCYGMSVVTALTAQNTIGVQGIFPVDISFVLQQLKSVFTDIPPAAVKIGMLHDAELIQGIAEFFNSEQYKKTPIVLDPVMVATSGDSLLKENALEVLKTKLIPLASLITPNLKEAEILLQKKIPRVEEMESAALELSSRYRTNVLIKGGHLFTSREALDVLVYSSGSKIKWYGSPRVKTKNSHGTGCTLSSAIASYLARGYELEDGVQKAKKYLFQALASAKDFSIGQGSGPVNHLWNWNN